MKKISILIIIILSVILSLSRYFIVRNNFLHLLENERNTKF